ncbi:MAG TPA: OmpW family outer membrane protein [Burkholderiaceae bacterium]|nr:OmpW family outer membrane protein [Burkholderiaceae bacterium]
MKTTTTIASLCTALALFTGSADASAQDSNDVRVGLYAVFYHTAADDIQGPFTPKGVTADVGNLQTVYLAYVRRLSPHFELELTAGVPPTSDTIGKGPAKLGSVPWNGQTVGTVKWLSPSVLLEYMFGEESAALRPFVGAGINFTHFYDRKVNANGQAALGGPTSISLNNSIGPAGTLGLYYRVLQHWHLVASFSAAQVESKLTTNTDGVIRRSNRVNFDPQTIVASVGYSF